MQNGVAFNGAATQFDAGPGPQSEVQAAFEYMKWDPGVEPWRALEMAKQSSGNK